MAAPQPTLDHSQRDSPTNPILITAFVVQLEGHQEPHNKVVSLSPAEYLPRFELGNFRFWLQPLNLLYPISLLRLKGSFSTSIKMKKTWWNLHYNIMINWLIICKIWLVLKKTCHEKDRKDVIPLPVTPLLYSCVLFDITYI